MNKLSQPWYYQTRALQPYFLQVAVCVPIHPIHITTIGNLSQNQCFKRNTQKTKDKEQKQIHTIKGLYMKLILWRRFELSKHSGAAFCSKVCLFEWKLPWAIHFSSWSLIKNDRYIGIIPALQIQRATTQLTTSTNKILY